MSLCRHHHCLVLLLLVLCPLLCADDRGIASVKTTTDTQSTGTFHYLGIGIDRYEHPGIPDLRSAVSGAVGLQKVLVRCFTFEKENCSLVLDEQATKKGILSALHELNNRSKDGDSIIIYYAGHGQKYPGGELGAWITHAADDEDTSEWISHGKLKGLLDGNRAKHLLLISDSCFSGNLLLAVRGHTTKIPDDRLITAFGKPSRLVMTSGGEEVVVDGGRNDQSAYTRELLMALFNTTNYTTPERVYDVLKHAMPENSIQRPLFGLLNVDGGAPDGTMILFRRDAQGLVFEDWWLLSGTHEEVHMRPSTPFATTLKPDIGTPEPLPPYPTIVPMKTYINGLPTYTRLVRYSDLYNDFTNVEEEGIRVAGVGEWIGANLLRIRHKGRTIHVRVDQGRGFGYSYDYKSTPNEGDQLRKNGSSIEFRGHIQGYSLPRKWPEAPDKNRGFVITVFGETRVVGVKR